MRLSAGDASDDWPHHAPLRSRPSYAAITCGGDSARISEHSQKSREVPLKLPSRDPNTWRMECGAISGLNRATAS